MKEYKISYFRLSLVLLGYLLYNIIYFFIGLFWWLRVLYRLASLLFIFGNHCVREYFLFLEI